MANLRKGTQQMSKVIKTFTVIDHIDMQIRMIEDNEYNIHLARVDMTGQPRTAQIFHLYKVERAYHNDIVYVLAQSEADAASQSMCDKPQEFSYNLWRDLESKCKVERVPLMIRGWGSGQF